MRPPVDEGDLVWIAAAASGRDPEALLAACDIAVLAGIVAKAESARSPLGAAAAVLVGIAHQRPFPIDNAATAWLAAAYLLTVSAIRVRMTDAEVATLVTAAGDGHMSTFDVVAALEAARPAPRRPLRELLRSMWVSPPKPPVTWDCPMCALPVRVPATDAAWMLGPNRPEARAVLLALCQRQHGSHRAARGPVPSSDVSNGVATLPVVSGPVRGGRPSFLVPNGPRPLAFMPEADNTSRGYHVLHLRELTVSDLLGSWERLYAKADRIDHVDAEAVHFDDDGRLIDSFHLAHQ